MQGKFGVNMICIGGWFACSHYSCRVHTIGFGVLPQASDWDDQVVRCLGERFADAPRQRAYYTDVWRDFERAGLSGDEFVSGLTGTSTTQFRQRVWEMLLARHLLACGHQVTSRPKGEPDFRFEVNGQVVWIEAISPTPGPDLPPDWTAFDPANPGPWVGNVPNREMLLRWTGAFNTKAEKCKEYRRRGVVRRNDGFVIAIDGSQLSKSPDTHGVSQMPFVVEAVFPIGPIAVGIDPDTGKLGPAFRTVEVIVENRNKSPVYKERFFRPEFAGVSAVLGSCPSPHAPPMLPVQIAYNPLAQAPVAPGHLGSYAEEWCARAVSQDAEGQDWVVERA